MLDEKKNDENDMDDRLMKLDKLLLKNNSDNDSDSDNSSTDGDSGSNNTGSGGSGGGRGIKFSESDDTGAGNQQESLVIGTDNYEQYVRAIEADKICSTVSDMVTKSSVYNKFRDDKAVDSRNEQKSRDYSDKSEQMSRDESRKIAYNTKKIARVNYEANLTTATAQRNFLRYRSKASLCGFDKTFDSETRDYGVSRDQFVHKHDKDGNGKITRQDIYLEKNDVNHDGKVDDHDKNQVPDDQVEK